MVAGGFKFGLFHNSASDICFNLKLLLPSMGQLGGMLHPKCNFRATDLLRFTASPPQSSVDLNLGFFTISLKYLVQFLLMCYQTSF
jgi:hypothetical protein